MTDFKLGQVWQIGDYMSEVVGLAKNFVQLDQAFPNKAEVSHGWTPDPEGKSIRGWVAKEQLVRMGGVLVVPEPRAMPEEFVSLAHFMYPSEIESVNAFCRAHAQKLWDFKVAN